MKGSFISLFFSMFLILTCDKSDKELVPAPSNSSSTSQVSTTTQSSTVASSTTSSQTTTQSTVTDDKCKSDLCILRTPAEDGTCKEDNLGTPVWENFNNGWEYGLEKQGENAMIAFYILEGDKTLYLLEQPTIKSKMLSPDPNEASTCDWCGCSSDCAFKKTTIEIKVSSTQKDGMVPLFRWVSTTNGINHRSSILTPGHGWNEKDDQGNSTPQGYVCEGIKEK